MSKKKDVLELNSNLQRIPIAVTGMSALFARARNLQEYWDVIFNKVDGITDVPSSRFPIEDYYDPNPRVPDKSYCKRGGFIPDIEFDPMEYGLPPNILEVTDIAQLLGLHVARQVLEDAGYGAGKEFDRDRTGVILGVVGTSMSLFEPLAARLQYPVWEKVMRAYGIPEADIQKISANIRAAYVPWEENSFPGVIANVISGRIANRFDLGGTNCVVDAACGSSIAAIKMAVSELVEGRADMMISGGVDSNNTVTAYISFSKTPAFSPGSNPRVFDANADGMMVGEGMGMIMLKRLADAERDGDRIYAVIRGIGSSSDGKYKSIYAPRAAGQAKALRRAYADAGIDPRTVTLIEAHGTGTPAGDPAEVEALIEIFGEDNSEKQYIGLGSVKSQIGHTKAAAGAAGFIKAALALHHKVLPPTINVSQPNPKFNLESSPFYINTETRPWLPPQPGMPRRAGVSSFGFGGTNFHLVLEEYTGKEGSTPRLNTTPYSIFLAADAPAALQETCRRALAALQSEDASQAFADLTALPASAKPAQARLGFLAATPAEARSQLQAALDAFSQKPDAESWEHPNGIFYRRAAWDAKARVVALFPGQGAQYVDMGKELALNFPPVRQVFTEADRLFVKDGEKPLSTVVFPIPVFDAAAKEEQNKRLTRTENAQPAIGALSVAMFKLLQAAGFQPDFVAGHSFGELTALWAGGVLAEEDFLALARARGRAMQAPDDPNFDAGTMLAVKGDAAKIRAEIAAFPLVTLANWNSNDQVVLAGTKPAITEVQKALQEKGYATTPLPVSAAFHTSLVKHAQQPFAKALQAVKFHPPQVPVYSNTTGKPHPGDPDQIRALMVEHILNPVLFKDEIENLYAAGGRIFVEIGPRNILTNLVKNILQDQPHLAVALNPNPKKDSDRQWREAALQLQVAGLPLTNLDPWQAAFKPEKAKKSPTTITLTGAQYVSPKRKAAFEAILAEPPQFAPPPSAQPPASPVAAGALERSLQQFTAYQMELIRVHDKFLAAQVEASQAVYNLVRQQVGLTDTAVERPAAAPPPTPAIDRAAAPTPAPAAAPAAPPAGGFDAAGFAAALSEIVSEKTGYPGEMLDPNMDLEADLGIDSIKRVEILGAIQERYPNLPGIPMSEIAEQKTLNQIVAFISGKVSAMPVSAAAPAAPAAPPAAPPAPPTGGLDAATFTAALRKVVSEKTGYPEEMLDLNMDMEADLGIDSIKRVEILGAIQEQFPNLPPIEMAQIGELKTLTQIIALVTSAPVTPPPAPATPPPVEAAAPSAPPAGAADAGSFKRALLEVVSEKTGYPQEMLDPNQDLEADLGIDSIKRVEILGAMQEKFPDLPPAEMETIAGLHTLQQVVDFFTRPGVETAPAPAAAELNAGTGTETSESYPAIPRRVVRTSPLPQPDWMDLPLPEMPICVLTNEGTALTANLAKKLIDEGWQVVVLSFPKFVATSGVMLPSSTYHFALDNLEEEHLSQRLADIRQKVGPVSVFIHLDLPKPVEAHAGELVFLPADRNILKHVFLVAKHLKEDLERGALMGFSAFVTVTQLDGALGANLTGNIAPVSAGLYGLVKTLSLEWENVFCRAIDLDPALEDERAATLIFNELHDPNRRITEVGLTAQGRMTLTVDEI